MQPGYVKEDQLNAAFMASIDPRVLSITLFSTEKCNFRCAYCYETFERGAMPPHVIKSVIKLIENRSDSLQQLSINWFGGEPLLTWRAIFDLYDRLMPIEAQANFDRSDSITTNAYLLTNEIAERLIAYRVRTFQITLDGSREFHDKTRPTRSGKPTFDKIYENLFSLKSLKSEFQVALRIHINATNYQEIPKFIELLDSDFGDDSRFGLNLVSVGNYGTGASDSFNNYASQKQMHDAFQAAVNNAKKLQILNTPQGSCYICYASKANSIVIRSDGELLKCTVAVDDPRNNVGRINDDGTLTIDQEKFRWWISGFDANDKQRLACPNSCR